MRVTIQIYLATMLKVVLDMCCVNAWLLWRRSNKEFDLPLKDFKLAIADSLCNLNREHKRRVGRPSAEVQTLYAMKKKRGPTNEIPQQEVRLDGMDHLPQWSEQQRSRCKFPLCQSKSLVSCMKCKVSLCFNKERNCFLRFHTE
ncbi:unnamed protein product [Acanthoscelides obtectus]|uniref:PiggyBac transposable element-derived protein domain-containing protein n=1 Tax=Acanthoscelides obtectus TaxID=200917 RepID=A0A9P0PW71_ACAOB|nr:unnamed protein product [Acanthoscelides obtectus]CAK1632942.1 hypothetical protein AOBTE_LOCUS7837 [Acanthoscelides obtectus]